MKPRTAAWWPMNAVACCLLSVAGCRGSNGEREVPACRAYQRVLSRCTGADDSFFSLARANLHPHPLGNSEREQLRAACLRDLSRVQRGCL